MKASRPHFALLYAAILAALFSACQQTVKREILRIGIDRVTHIAVGQSTQLSAYQEYTQQSGEIGVVHAASTDAAHREAIAPRWSISDSSLATVNEDGTLTAMKPGRVTVRSVWKNYEAVTTVEVVRNLAVSHLPKLSTQGTNCKPQSVVLSLAPDRALKFHLSFADGNCPKVAVETSAPEQPLPWKFDFPGGALELTAARGMAVNGEVRLGGGQVSFTVWSEGDGTYPISLTNKTILLTGDSMAEGIGWSMREKVEAAGGRLIVQPWYSSTTIGWQGEGRIKEYIERYYPDIIFIALGSNEIFTTDMEARARAVRGITADIGEVPAYWIGPPSWKPDKGIVRTIEENFLPGHFYNSNDLVVPRRRDGAHPTVEGYVTWTELIWDWYARIG